MDLIEIFPFSSPVFEGNLVFPARGSVRGLPHLSPHPLGHDVHVGL